MVGDSGWVPVQTWFEVGGGACAEGIIDGYAKEQNFGTREQRVVTFANGDRVTLLRGTVTLSVGIQWDGWLPIPDYVDEPRPDVLVDGDVARVDYASGSVFMRREAGNIVAIPVGSGTPQAMAYADAGLHSFYYLKKGEITEYVTPRASIADLSIRTSSKLISVCNLINRPAGASHPTNVYTAVGIGEPIFAAYSG